MAGQAKQTKISIAIGIRIEKGLNKKNISTGDFSKIMEVDASTVSNWKSGKAAFPAHQLIHIAKKLDVDPAWLLTGRKELAPGWLLEDKGAKRREEM